MKNERVVNWKEFLVDGFMVEDLVENHDDFFMDLNDWENEVRDYGVTNEDELFAHVTLDEDFGYFDELEEYILDDDFGLNCDINKLDFIKPEKREELIDILLSKK